MTEKTESALGSYLKDRRSRIDPATFGFSTIRRRTSGLRREEVAQLSNISPTWYTWLEQGRGGAPSVDVLNRIAAGLMLTEQEREHLFMLARGHPPDVKYRPTEGVTPRLQRLLDALEVSPAFIRTATWDVVAWNRAAAAVLTDYGSLPPEERNILRLIFCNARVRRAQTDWEGVARFVVSTFRTDVTRAGASAEVQRLVEELIKLSPEFEALWKDKDVRVYGEGIKRLNHASIGLIELEYSGFAVDGRPDLGMVVYNPSTSADASRIRTLIADAASSGSSAMTAFAA
ncbi:helix-turn-helix domain-containing protein [Undibacterium sp. CY18W]|uniref:Helix-turn-helix domain-containing protein n=1 Tax=Undibacterium hunanense TaxID=2762292 RepID=A0ABR6ZL19_9BURK|nr:helix-turn-helix transcriptional regulator [Undibacterium hunanense]MBC3916494.1 helix-turn-helix domain-containing protein [Undibacterium hunanense]